jgi:hypothetical protein
LASHIIKKVSKGNFGEVEKKVCVVFGVGEIHV